jgi:hypothetical protein
MRVSAIFFWLMGVSVLMMLTGAGRSQPPMDATFQIPTPLPAFVVYDGRFPPITQDGKTERDPRDRTGKIHCFICEYGLAPTFVIFLRADPKDLSADSPFGKLLRALDASISKYRGYKLNGLIVFLRTEAGEKAVKLVDSDGQERVVAADKDYPDDDNRDRYVREIRDWIQALKLMNIPVALAPLTNKNIRAWGVKDDEAAMVVVYRRLKPLLPPVHFANLNALTDEQAKTIIDAVAAASQTYP